MGVGPEKGWLLSLFGAHVQQAFGHTAYQVGSSLTQKNGWRDVDVRLILPDDEYTAYFGDPMTSAHNAPKLMMWDMAWGAFGAKFTRLPIDFQFQHQTLCNEEFDGVRSALLILSTDLPTVAAGSKGGT